MLGDRGAQGSALTEPVSEVSRRPAVTAVVTGASGQDGFYLTKRLLDEGSCVHAVVRSARSLDVSLSGFVAAGQLVTHELDLLDSEVLTALVRAVQPDEIYNLAGQSSVSESFRDPRTTWLTNTQPVLAFLDAIRDHSPRTRLYQASSSEMFGGVADGAEAHGEHSPLRPSSPYAAAKAASHLACGAYRDAFGLRIGCGILFNHESSRRPPTFLTRKIVDHVLALGPAVGRRQVPPLRMGNMLVQRDWGFAPDYVDGIIRITRQIATRAKASGLPGDPDEGRFYRDYVLGTGRLLSVWELVDRAFCLAGHELDWAIEESDPSAIEARFRLDGMAAVIVDRSLFRPADPAAIRADATRARTELGWEPRTDADTFLAEMMSAVAVPVG